MCRARALTRLATLLPMCYAANGFAEGGAHPAPPAPVVSFGSLLQVFVSLALVLAAVAGVAWLLKRLNPQQAGHGGALRVVGATAVGQRERVVVVEIDDTWLVVGVAPGQVRGLHSMPKPEMPATPSAAAQPEAGFASWLKQTLERRRG